MNNDLEKFYNNLAGWYDLMYLAQGVKASSYTPAVVDAFDWLIKQKQVTSVLDCACGTGDPLLGLYKLTERTYTLVGSDGSAGMLKKCSENAANVGISITDTLDDSSNVLPVIHCTWSDLSTKFVNERFDLVICRGHGFYHLTTRDAMHAALRSFSEITTQGGWILIDTLYWTYDASGMVCGERGRDLAKWRGCIDFTAEPELRAMLPSTSIMDDIQKIYFIDVTDYRTDAKAVGGVVQTKTVVVFGENKEGKVIQIGNCSASGAAFSPESGMTLLEEVGLVDIHQVSVAQFAEFEKHVVLLGRKYNS